MRAVRIIGKIVGWTLLSLLGLVVSTLLTLVIVGRTDWGHRKILSIALPAIQKQLAGHLKVGRLGGDLTHGLVLYDVELDDIEHRPAVKVRALTVRYDLLALARHTIHLTELRAEGAWLHARPLRDGRLNLSTLAKPSNPSEQKQQSQSSYKIRLGRVVADLDARVDRVGQPDRTIHGTVKLDAHASIDGQVIDVGIDELAARASRPLVASVDVKGGAHVDHDAVSAHKLDVVATADGRELRKLTPDVALRGPFRVELRADGPADNLDVLLLAKPPAGRLAVDATVRTGKTIGWRATVDARGIDPGAAVAGAPHGDVRLSARGRGQDARGTIDLESLVAAIAGTRVEARGTVDTSGDANLMADVAARDLSTLRALGLRGLAGSIKARARVERTRTHLHVDVDAAARALAYGGHRFDRLDAHVHDRDFIGEAHVTAAGVRAGGVALDTLAIDAHGDPRAVAAKLDARGPDHTELALEMHGTPTVARHRGGVEGVKITGADLTIDKLVVARYNVKWSTTGPAALAIHDSVALRKLELVQGAQRLGLDASYGLRDQAIGVHLRAQKLNVRQLAHLAKPSLDLPDTELDIDARAHGTRAAPVADVSLRGFSVRSPRLGLNRIHYRLDARYADERVAASWALDAIDQSFHGKADVPTVLTGARRISAELEAKNIWMVKLHKVLPPQLASLDGRLDGQVRLGGTTARPQLDLDLHGRNWQLGPESKNHDVKLDVDYKERRLTARLEAHLEQSLGKDAGALKAQVEAPIDLSLAKLQQSRRLIAQLEHKTAVVVDVTMAKLDLGRVPFAQVGVAPPVRAGVVDGTIKLRGTLHQPVLDADVKATGLARGKLDKLDVTVAADYADARARLRVDSSLRGAPLLAVRGESPIDVERVIDKRPYRDTPVRVDARIDGYDLARLADLEPKLAGTMRMSAEVRGTIARPTGKLDAAIAALNLGEMRYDKFEAHANYDGARAVAKLDAHEVKGGALTADATLPMDASKPLAAAVRARGFYVDIENPSITNPRLLKGTLEASIDAKGTRARPVVAGFLRFSDGQLALASDPRVFKEVKVDVVVDQNGWLTLKEAKAKVGEGSVVANGSAKLNGVQVQSVDLRAYPRKFPIPTGQFGAWLDADIVAHGEQTADGLSGTVTLQKGTANLPKLSGGKKLQSTGPLEDVKFVDPAARRAEARRKAAESAPATSQIAAHIPGPFHVRSKELSTDLKGDLDIEIVGPVARITGTVESLGGWMELLGRRYNLDKVRVGFGGEADPDPELDIRLTRELTQTMIVIEVHGTAKKPQVVLASDPPIYDQSEVIAAILSGDPANQRVDDRSLDKKVTGAVSSLLVGKIKDQIAPNLPIDVIKVDTGTEGATGLADTRIEVGKYVTDTVYVSYVHQFGSTLVGTQRVNSNEADLDWRFKKHYDLETAFGDAAVGRVNLYWTIRY